MVRRRYQATAARPKGRATNAICPVFLQPPHLSLADHVHRLDTLNRSRGRIEGAKSLTGSHQSFDRSVILLHDVVEVADRTTPAASSEFSGELEFSNDLRIGRIPIHVDHPWAWVAI